MCKMSTEFLAVAGGGSLIATAATFVRVHWDMLRDREAYEAAKKRRERGEEEAADQGESIEEDTAG